MNPEQTEALAAAIAGTGTNRDRVHQALKNAGRTGITENDLRKLVGGGVAVHLESLRYEGHVINTATRSNPGRLERWFFLARDAWDDE